MKTPRSTSRGEEGGGVFGRHVTINYLLKNIFLKN